MRKITVALALLSFAAGAAAQKPAIHVNPRVSLQGVSAPLKISVSGLRPDDVVRLTLSTKDAHGNEWRSSALYHADLEGVLDLSKAAPLRGSYEGADPMGLFWSMMPPKGKRIEFSHPDAGVRYTLTARVGNEDIAHATILRKPMSPDIVIRKIRENGLVADLYASKTLLHDGKRHPAVIALGGSEGGIDAADYYAQWLSSHGFVVLALGWYHLPGLSKDMVHVPVEIVHRGLRFLTDNPSIDPDRIGIIGGSWGAMLAMLSAAHMPAIHAVVSWMGGPVIGQGLTRGSTPATSFRVANQSPFTYRGKPVPFVSDVRLAKAIQENDYGAVSKATIPVWKIKAPILFVAGGDDQLEDSAVQAEWAMQALRHHGHGYADKVLFLRNAGHLVWPGYAPTTQLAKVSEYEHIPPVGGSPRGYAEADARVGREVLDFLRRSLSAGSQGVSLK